MTFEDFLKGDHEGHLGHSAVELRRHADQASKLTVQQRREYFSGITTVFPLMLLSHHYEWLSGKDSADYIDCFVPVVRATLQPQTDAMLDTLYRAPEQDHLWSALLSIYLSTVPYAILRAFASYALTAEHTPRMEKFVCRELTEVIPALAERLVACETDPKKRIDTVVYLGCDYPFELLQRFHSAVVAPEE